MKTLHIYVLGSKASFKLEMMLGDDLGLGLGLLTSFTYIDVIFIID